MSSSERSTEAVVAASEVSLAQATRVWARIGLLSFGGPAGQIALMHRVLVEETRWITERRFLHALNFCMLLPGPEAQQLATYVGWHLHRIRGGLIAGSLFVLPGFIVMLGLSYLYVAAGDLSLVQGLFAGLKPAVVVIVLQAVVRIGRRSLAAPAPAALAVLAFAAMYVFRLPFPLVILAAAAVGALMLRRRDVSTGEQKIDGASANRDDAHGTPAGAGISRAARCVGVFGFLWIAPTAGLLTVLGPDDTFTQIGIFFSQMAVVTFGGAYAVLAYVSQEAVSTYGWLSPGEMIDGLAMAETTPGPLIMVTQFVGSLAAYRNPGGLSPDAALLLGGMLTTWVTFTPCFLWIFLGAPYMERLENNLVLSGALAGVSAAVVGVIVNLALWFSLHTLFAEVVDRPFAGVAVEVPALSSVRLPPLFITLVAALLVFGFRTSILTTLAVAGALGIASVWL